MIVCVWTGNHISRIDAHYRFLGIYIFTACFTFLPFMLFYSSSSFFISVLCSPSNFSYSDNSLNFPIFHFRILSLFHLCCVLCVCLFWVFFSLQASLIFPFLQRIVPFVCFEKLFSFFPPLLIPCTFYRTWCFRTSFTISFGLLHLLLISL